MMHPPRGKVNAFSESRNMLTVSKKKKRKKWDTVSFQN